MKNSWDEWYVITRLNKFNVLRGIFCIVILYCVTIPLMSELEATHLNVWLGWGSEEQQIIQWEVFADAKFREIAVFALDSLYFHVNRTRQLTIPSCITPFSSF